MVDHFVVTLTPAAYQDMLDIAAFIAGQRGMDRGDAFLNTMIDRIAALEQFPLRGARPKELEGSGSAGFRQILSGPYRLIYSVFGDKVAVLLIADGRRDMQALLRDRLLNRDPT